MSINFYTAHTQFTIFEDKVFKNGEVIAEGSIFVFQLILGLPAWIIVNGELIDLPTIIHTSKVISVLPEHEKFDGESIGAKTLFNVSFTVLNKKKPVSQNMSIYAIDEAHVKDLIEIYFHKDSIHFETIQRVNKQLL